VGTGSAACGAHAGQRLTRGARVVSRRPTAWPAAAARAVLERGRSKLASSGGSRASGGRAAERCGQGPAGRGPQAGSGAGAAGPVLGRRWPAAQLLV